MNTTLVIAFAWVSGGLLCIKHAMASNSNADAEACFDGLRRAEPAAIVALCAILAIWPAIWIGAHVAKLREHR